MSEESGCNNGSSRECRVDRDVKFERFCVDITNVYTTFMGEEDRVTFTSRSNTDIEFGMRWMREERFNDEVRKYSRRFFNLLKIKIKSMS